MNPEIPVTLVGLMIAVAVVVMLGWLAIKDKRRSRLRDLEAAADEGQTQEEPKRTPGWVWVFLVTVIVLITSIVREKSGTEPPLVSPLSTIWVLPLVMFLGLVGLVVWSRTRPINRAARKAGRGDIAGAIADIQAGVDRTRGRSPAPVAIDANPWAAPLSASSAQKRKLADNLNALGAFEGMRGNWTTALDWFEQADREVVGVPMYLANRGIALVRLKRASEGLELLGQAVKNVPRSDHCSRSQMLTQQADALIELSHLDEARTVLDQAEQEWKLFKIYPASSKKPLLTQIETLRARLTVNPIEGPTIGTAARIDG